MFDKYWWRRFLQRYEDRLGVQTVSGLEDDRGNVEPEKVIQFYESLEKLLPLIEHPCQLINIDEEGFCARPEKGKRKKIVFMKNNPQKPYFKEEIDPLHVSVVGAITRCDRIKPVLILGRQSINESNDDIAIRRESFYYFRTGSGYATTESTLFFIRNILRPYITKVRFEKQKVLPFILIMDGLPAHKNLNVMNEINSIGNMHVFFLPPHSSHFLQPLDLFVFFQHKKLYADSLAVAKQSDSSSSGIQAFSDKVVRVLDTWESIQTKYILTAWQRACIELTPVRTNTLIFRFYINYLKVQEAIAENCKDGASFILNDKGHLFEKIHAIIDKV